MCSDVASRFDSKLVRQKHGSIHTVPYTRSIDNRFVRMFRLSFLVLVLVVSFDSVRADPPTQTAVKLDATIQLKMNYLLYLPKDYESKDSWPLVLFLHGAGERGDNIDKVKTHGPPKLIEQGKEFPFIVVSPQCPDGRWWEASELASLLDHVIAEHRVDEDRVCLTGLSMGGFGTWRLAFLQPHRFAAIAPICGGGEPYWGKQIAHIAVWAFHGGVDFLVPVARSQSMVDAIKKANGEPKLTIYPDAGHDSWTKAYENQELYEWMLSQRRSKPKP